MKISRFKGFQDVEDNEEEDDGDDYIWGYFKYRPCAVFGLWPLTFGLPYYFISFYFILFFWIIWDCFSFHFLLITSVLIHPLLNLFWPRTLFPYKKPKTSSAKTKLPNYQTVQTPPQSLIFLVLYCVSITLKDGQRLGNK